MQKFEIEFILCTYGTNEDSIRGSLAEFGENVEIVDCRDAQGSFRNFKINLVAEDATVIFDVCSRFGRIKSVKVDEA